ncbi:MAG: autotransporter-associated beta strand repeat-containing protein [Akkermansiaceae bacterium]
MKPKHIHSRRSPASAKSTLFGITLAGAVAFVSIPSTFAASQTWDGGAATNILNTADNWTNNATPTSATDDATWDGSVAGNLSLIWNASFGPGSGNSGGVDIVMAATQTGSLQLDATSGSLGLGDITIAADAGAFTLGDGAGTASVVFRDPTTTFTNSSSNTATFKSDIVTANGGGGGNRNVTFDGTGNWSVEGTFFASGFSAVSSAFFTKSGTGTLTLAGANSNGGTTVISGGTIAITNGSALGTGNVTLSGGRLALSNNITVASSVTGPANYNLSGSNNAASDLTSAARILNSSGNNTISGNINFANVGGTFVNIHSAAGTLTLDGNIAATLITGTGRNFNFTGAGDIVSNGDISDGTVAVGVHKGGAGTLTLTGTNNTYTGDTLVSVGTLLVNGSLGNSAVTVAADATIGGTGSLAGTLGFDGDALLEVVNFSDPLEVTGTITFGSGFGIDNLTGIDWGSLALNTEYTVISTSQIFSALDIANFGSVNAASVGGGRFAYFESGSLAVVVIPEPGAALLGAIGSFLLLGRRRRC